MNIDRLVITIAGVFIVGSVLLGYFFQLILELRNSVIYYPAVRFYLFLPSTPHTDTSFLSIQMLPHSTKSWQQVLQLG